MWIRNGQVYDVHAGKFSAQDIEVEEGRIVELGRAAQSGPDDVDMEGAYILPGFIDCHVHICVNTDSPNANNPWRDSLPGTVAIYAARGAERMLRCGITTARDVGGWDYHEIAVREAVNAGWIEGSRLFCSGKILTQTSSSTPYYLGMYEEVDGPEEVLKGARKQLAMGADFIKLLATGAMTSTKYEKADAIQLRPEEIRAAVQIAQDNRTHVAAHAHACEGIKNAVDCGCRTVEHGSFGTEEVYGMMVEKETFLVPTICVSSAMFKDPTFAAKVPAHIRTRYEELRPIRVANITLAHRLGVKIAMGTDVGTPGNHAGDNMQEVEQMVDACGMSPAEAIYASTWNGACVLGQEAHLGSLENGKIADLIAVDRNPLEDISVLYDVFFVMKDGKAYRNDRV
ncbi:MAG: amidohydrolase family protein [Pseudomonadota bacterium]